MLCRFSIFQYGITIMVQGKFILLYLT